MASSYTPLFPQLNGLLHGGDYNPDQWLDRPDILEKDVELMKKSRHQQRLLGHLCLVRPGTGGGRIYL